MNIIIKATNIELTSNIKEYVEEKINSLDKYFNNIIEARIEIGINSQRHQKGEIFFAEANIKIPGKLLRVVKTEKKLFKAIDKVKDHLRVILRRHKEKIKGRVKTEK
ncbi:MAG: ribosome-associated translation inhibitor RaiA [Patescibacteria group bacterium]|nr:ribosome-associated translation inhibitor RaiA [Patescibacteria group bacterium]